jgi:hypothetical protein
MGRRAEIQNTRAMTRIKKTCLFALLLVTVPLQGADDSTVVGRIFDKQITAGEIGLKFASDGQPVLPTDPATCLKTNPVAELQKRILQEMQREAVAARGWTATEAEITEMATFQQEFMVRDKLRREQDLVSIERQLAEGGLDEPTKARLGKRLETLRSLAGHDQRMESMPKLPPEMLRMVHAPWIEAWKYHREIYEEFGGVVSSTKFGLDPVGAKAALAEKLSQEGKLTISDARLSEAFWQSLRAAPKVEAKPEEIDFTPFWKKAHSLDEARLPGPPIWTTGEKAFGLYPNLPHI